MFIVVSIGENIYALTFENQFHERLMEVGWNKSLLELNRYSSNEQRYILGRALQAFASDQIPRDPSRQESLELAQSVLLATPGHAKYYQEKIESLREIARVNAKTPEEMANNMGNYNDFRKGAFKVLGLLPSSEAIAVLGHFLNDPEGKDGKDLLGYPMRVSEVVPYPPNFGAAWIALSNIGIANPPAVGKKPERDTFFTTSVKWMPGKAGGMKLKTASALTDSLARTFNTVPTGQLPKKSLSELNATRNAITSAPWGIKNLQPVLGWKPRSHKSKILRQSLGWSLPSGLLELSCGIS